MEKEKAELLSIIENSLTAMPDELEKVGDYYIKKDQLDRYNELAEQLYIPGTNIMKPRDRKVEETDQEYEKFLSDYYSNIFKQEDKNESSEIEPMPPLEDINKDDSVVNEQTNEVVQSLPKDVANTNLDGDKIDTRIDNIELFVNNSPSINNNEQVISDSNKVIVDENFEVVDVYEYKESKPTLRQKIKNSLFLEKAIGWVFDYVDAVKKDVKTAIDELDKYEELKDTKLDSIEDEEIVDTHDVNIDLSDALAGVDEENISDDKSINEEEIVDMHDANFDINDILDEISGKNDERPLSDEEIAVNEVLDNQEEFNESPVEQEEMKTDLDDLLSEIEESNTVEPLNFDRKPVMRNFINVGMDTVNLPLSAVHPLAITGEIEDLEPNDLHHLMNSIRNETGEEYNYLESNKHQMETLDNYVLIDDQDELVVSSMYYVGPNDNLNVINNTFGFDDLKNVIIGLSDKDEVARGTVAYISADSLKKACDNIKNNNETFIENNEVGFSK